MKIDCELTQKRYSEKQYSHILSWPVRYFNRSIANVRQPLTYSGEIFNECINILFHMYTSVAKEVNSSSLAKLRQFFNKLLLGRSTLRENTRKPRKLQMPMINEI